jgi:hypothetical protein
MNREGSARSNGQINLPGKMPRAGTRKFTKVYNSLYPLNGQAQIAAFLHSLTDTINLLRVQTGDNDLFKCAEVNPD